MNIGSGGFVDREILCCVGRLDRTAPPDDEERCGREWMEDPVSWLVIEEDEDLLEIEYESIEFQDTELLVEAKETL